MGNARNRFSHSRTMSGSRPTMIRREITVIEHLARVASSAAHNLLKNDLLPYHLSVCLFKYAHARAHSTLMRKPFARPFYCDIYCYTYIHIDIMKQHYRMQWRCL